MITENLSTLKIHKLTQEQYERELAAGRIDENALYLTPDEAKVADAVKYTEQTLTEEQQAQARANIGVGQPIIDVTELPTENIQEDYFYRLLTGTFISNGAPNTAWTCLVVDELPKVGEPVTTDMVNVFAYYNTSDSTAYGYVDSVLSGTGGVPVDWYPLSALAESFDVTYGGVISSIKDATNLDAVYLLVKTAMYSYDGAWTTNEQIGYSGTGYGAEVFNGVQNIASGNRSHAEGYRTTASGSCSHAEGYYTIANGGYSHAEGYDTTASGGQSHAEGWATIAAGAYQHAQGRYNIKDTDNKYAHIVGNGDGNGVRSNAHTLDWNGLGWFAGGLKVGGTGQDDVEAKRVLTEDDRADWDIADESLPGAIKNKPFGYVTGMVDVLSNGEYYFKRPTETTTDIVHYCSFEFEDDIVYSVSFDGISLGQVQCQQRVDIQNGQFYFAANVLVITGGYPEGQYTVHIQKEGIVTKKINPKWLAIDNTLGYSTNPVQNAAVTAKLDLIETDLSTVRTDLSAVQSVANKAMDTANSAGQYGYSAYQALYQDVEPRLKTAEETIADHTTRISALEQGGNNRMVVTWDGDTNNPASKTPTEIYEHIKNGGTAVCCWDDVYYPLSQCLDNFAVFTSISDDKLMTHIAIGEDGQASVEEDWGLASQKAVANVDEKVTKALGDIDTALDAIIAIQEQLIGGSVTLITFTINSTEYQAEEGMTWSDLVGSEYDSDNRVVIQGGGLVGFKTSETTTWNVMNESGDLEYESDIIRSGHFYGLD